MSISAPETNVPQSPISVKLGAPKFPDRNILPNPASPASQTRPLNTQLPLFPASMTPHSNSRVPIIRGNKDIVWTRTSYYGVSTSRRVLSPQLLLKRFDQVRNFLSHTLHLTSAEREVTFHLLRLWAYYGNVYPKAAMLAEYTGCSKATYWRAVRKLRDLGLVTVIPRFLTPYRRQISNLYRLDKVILLIAKYLAEHGVLLPARWLKPYLLLPWPDLWAAARCSALIFATEGFDLRPTIPPLLS